MKVKIKENAFTGLTQFNGQTATLETDKDGQPVAGASGETTRFILAAGGTVYLSTDQYVAMDDGR